MRVWEFRALSIYSNIKFCLVLSLIFFVQCHKRARCQSKDYYTYLVRKHSKNSNLSDFPLDLKCKIFSYSRPQNRNLSKIRSPCVPLFLGRAMERLNRGFQFYTTLPSTPSKTGVFFFAQKFTVTNGL